MHDALQGALDDVAILLTQPAGRAAQDGTGWNLIHRRAGFHLGDGDDASAGHRIEIARHHRLHGDDGMAGGDHRIAGKVGQSGMAAMAIEMDIEAGAGRHHGTVMHGDRAGRQARPIVPAENTFHREALEQPVLDHGLCAAGAFFRRLKHQMHGARPIGIVLQQRCSAEQGDGVTVMAAGMHHAGVARAPGQILGCLFDRQRVHVGAQADGSIAIAPQSGDDTMAADAFDDVFHAELFEFFDDKACRLALMQGKPGVGVQMATPSGECVDQGCVHRRMVRSFCTLGKDSLPRAVGGHQNASAKANVRRAPRKARTRSTA